MKLRFEINQAEAFRRGINAPKSIVTIEVDPSTLNQSQRTLIADRMKGIDLYKLRLKNGKRILKVKQVEGCVIPDHIMALDPNLESLLTAIIDDEKHFKDSEQPEL